MLITQGTTHLRMNTWRRNNTVRAFGVEEGYAGQVIVWSREIKYQGV
jgi:hypothetical protein